MSMQSYHTIKRAAMFCRRHDRPCLSYLSSTPLRCPDQAQLSLAKADGPGAKLSHLQGQAAECRSTIKKLQVGRLGGVPEQNKRVRVLPPALEYSVRARLHSFRVRFSV